MRIKFSELLHSLELDPFYGSGGYQIITQIEKDEQGQDIEVQTTHERLPEDLYPNTKMLICKIYSENARHQLFLQFRSRWNLLPCKGTDARHLAFLWCGMMGLPTYHKNGTPTHWEREEFLITQERQCYLKLDELKTFLQEHQLPLIYSLYPKDSYNSFHALDDIEHALHRFLPNPQEYHAEIARAAKIEQSLTVNQVTTESTHQHRDRTKKMYGTLWAPYGDAIKLILTGTTLESLSPDQNTIFVEMLAQGMRDTSGNILKKRHLPGVQTQNYCTNEEKQEFEVYYYTPDLFIYMLELFDKWSIFAPPVDLDFLNSLSDEAGKLLFIFSDAPGHRAWEQSSEGQNHWSMVCRKMQVEDDIAELDRTHHSGDPLKLEAQKRMRSLLNIELAELDKKLTRMEQPQTQDEHTQEQKHLSCNKNNTSALPGLYPPYIAYPKALGLLAKRWDATPEEIAEWVFLGPETGGLAAYLNANELNPPPRFYYGYGCGHDFDYLIPLMACWFLEHDIANFKPADRFITGEALIERWEDIPGIQPEAFIQAKIEESRLMDSHPIFGLTQGSTTNESFPPLNTGLFSLSSIEQIEETDFSTSQRDILKEREQLHKIQEGNDDDVTPSFKKTSPQSAGTQDKSVEADNNNHDPSDDEWSTVFDPLPLSGIAKMFILERDEKDNLKKWKNYANKASINDLNCARISKGRGNAESVFNPWLVAEWLIKKGHYARDKAERKLASNLPPRSAHLKDLIIP